VLVQMYKQSPFWPAFANNEAKFIEFVQAFCEWVPESETDNSLDDAELIDITFG
jgi:hypothetical protein